MGTFKKTKVIMLSTNEKSKLVLSYCNELAINWTHDLAKFDDATYQNLYFLSDEEIKEGDWCLDVIAKQVFQVDSKILNSIKSFEKERFKKIIATTDKSLSKTIKSSYVQFGDNVEETRIEFLPQPSQSFIEKFVEEYNKGNVITEVMVEYEDKVAMDGHTIIGSELKISKDNTITIRKVKDSWNRDEVVELAKKYAKRCQAPMTDNKWFEENL